MKTLLAIAIVLGAALPGAARAADCIDCHSDKVDAKRFGDSAHGGKGAGTLTATCQSCHADVKPTDDGHAKPAKVDCARCHEKEKDKLALSTHKEMASCSDCHGTHYVDRMAPGNHRNLKVTACGNCHEKAMAEYKSSFHGKSSSERVATCADCHGSHGIKAHTDPDSSVYRLNLAGTCAACHADQDNPAFTPEQIGMVKDYFSSAHGIAVAKGGLLVAATCMDCHGNHNIAAPTSKDSLMSRARIPETCGRCHVGVLKTYMASVHGGPFLDGNTDVPVCTDCHRTHQIKSHLDPQSSTYATHVSPTCLKCHANAQYITRYGFPGVQGQTYSESYHGAASRLGDPNVANCSSCHGSHDIRKAADPKSSTNPANMTVTCGKCHKVEDPSKPMALGRIHQSLAEENHWLTGVVRNVYLVLICGTLGFFAFFIVIDLRKRLVAKGSRH